MYEEPCEICLVFMSDNFEYTKVFLHSEILTVSFSIYYCIVSISLRQD